MEQVKFCRHCGELLESQWFHCPWCGKETLRRDPDWQDMLDSSLGQAESEQNRGTILLLNNLSIRLEELESELDEFLATRTV